MQELKISEFSFHEFLEQFQAAVLDGYELDLESNERFPQKFGSHLEVTLVKLEDMRIPVPKPEVVTEVTPEVVTTEDSPVVASNGTAEDSFDEVVSKAPAEVTPPEILVVASPEQVTKTRKPKGS